MNITLHPDGEWEVYCLAAHDVELDVIPALGAKISSIRVAGEEILDRSPRRASAAHRAHYAAPYTDKDAWAFDECLPTVAPCRYPEFPWQEIEVPDHGEVWSIPWTAHAQESGLHLATHGVRFPYEFQKSIALPAPGRINLRYSLTNFAPLPFRYLWSSHPLLASRPGSRLHLPAGVSVLVDFSKNERLGAPGTTHTWPHTLDRAGQAVDLSQLLPPEAGSADKLYTTRLTDGWCAVHDPASHRYVAMLFSSDEIPYLGIWLNQGAWPLDGPGAYNLGLEPCRGFPDRLDLAVARGACSTLGPGETSEWRLDICAGTAPDMLSEIDRLRRAITLAPTPRATPA